MDSPYFLDKFENFIQSNWSMRGDALICSVGAPATDVPLQVMTYMKPVPYLLNSTTRKEILEVLDFTKYAIWYNPEEHWLGWIPVGPPADDAMETEEYIDPVGFCFDESPIETTTEHADVYYSSDEGNEPRSVLAGWTLDQDWKEVATLTGERLLAICLKLASTNGFYNRGSHPGSMGDVPQPVDFELLGRVFYTDKEAQDAALVARRALLSQLGFVSWFQSVVHIATSKLSAEDKEYVTNLRLPERPKTGVLYNLPRDIHEVNFAHLLHHQIRFHYVWSDKERSERRLLRFSPEYYNEISVLRDRADGGEIRTEDLPSYELWRDDLESSDWIGQNL
jgi:hypothetical protein